MAEYKQLGNYVLFEETFADSMGRNFRVGEIEGQKIKNHKILSDVKPLFYSDPKIWKILRTLLEGIKKSNIVGLYSPEEIINISGKQLLIFPFMHFRNFESVLEDSQKKGIPINFDLAFSIAIAIADLLEIGSSIVISGQKSFHGFLTPDNILIDHEGKIYLKNYGILPYISQNEKVYNEMEKHYGAWLTPEFFRKEKIVPQSDIYHLGYLLFKMLTGKYFSYSPGENFEQKISNISFAQSIPDLNKDFIDGLLGFFRKTLNPDPSKRFSGIREFKEYISSAFHIEELSSVTFNLAYFMDSLYAKARENEQKLFEKELSYSIPDKKPKQPEKADSELVESILSSLDIKERQGRPKLIYILVPVLIIAAIAIWLYISQANKVNKIKKQGLEQAKILQLENQRKIAALQKKIRMTEEKAAKTEEEKKKQEEDRQKLLDQLALEKKEKARLKKIEDDKQKQILAEEKLKEDARKKQLAKEEEQNRIKAEKERKRLEDERKRKLLAEQNKAKFGQVVSMVEVDQKPVPISTPPPVLPIRLRAASRSKILLSILISETGNVEKIRFLRKSEKNEVNKLLQRMIAKWKYSPAMKDGVKVKVWKTLTLDITNKRQI